MIRFGTDEPTHNVHCRRQREEVFLKTVKRLVLKLYEKTIYKY